MMRSPSPSLRYSPSKGAASHKRGGSLESAIHPNRRDDDLTLFTDIENRTRDNFLLQPCDDFDDSISKLRYCSDYKIGINIPPRGESSDLLKADGDKDDYEWLLTPPETPLFHSLDDEEPQSMPRVTRGRPQTKPISISRASTFERNPRSGRSSASPNRLSSSPQSRRSLSLSRATLSTSSSRSSPPPVLPPTPSRRPSPPPAAKQLVNTRRSASPSLRRGSTGSAALLLPHGKRAASPIKTSRGTSASPKMRTWQSDAPGFSSDAPPNLRTSVADHYRGVSPPVGHESAPALRYRAQSMSPTPSRSGSSSISNERDHFGSSGKVSAASVMESDADSLHSLPTGVSVYPAARQNSGVVKNRLIVSSRKVAKNPPSSSAPKRSFDSALWLMDHRKAAQSMFRPLLSSVPTTSFSIGSGYNTNQTMFSMNSSLTTSSNASSEHGTGFAPYMDNEHQCSNFNGECRASESDIHEEIFVLDKAAQMDEEGVNNGQPSMLVDGSQYDESNLKDFGKEKVCLPVTPYAATVDFGVDLMLNCSRCGRIFRMTKVDDVEAICEHCDEKTIGELKIVTSIADHPEENLIIHRTKQTGVSFDPPAEGTGKGVVFPSHPEINEEPVPDFLGKSDSSELGSTKEVTASTITGSCEPGSLLLLREEPAKVLTTQDDSEQHNCSKSIDNVLKVPQSTITPSHRVEGAEGQGIAVLLQKSGSSKGTILDGRTLTAAPRISFSEPRYARDNLNLTRGSAGRDSSSASSMDIGSFQPHEFHFQRFMTGKRGDCDKALSSTLSAQSSCSISDMSISGSSAQNCPRSYVSDDFPHIVDVSEGKAFKMAASVEEQSHSFGQVCAEAEFIKEGNGKTLSDAGVRKVGQLAGEDVVGEDNNFCKVADSNFIRKDRTSSSGDEVTNIIQERCFDEEGRRVESICDDGVSNITRCSSACNSGQPDGHNGFLSEDQLKSPQPESDAEKVIGSVVIEEADQALTEPIQVEPPEGKHEERTAMARCSDRQIRRSFTLEEATDAILFCSSIVHDLAYKAAAIGIERELEALSVEEAPRPTVTFPRKPSDKQQDLPSARNNKHMRKVKRKRPETELAALPEKVEAVKSLPSTRPVPAGVLPMPDSLKPPKLESKCNCTIM